MRKYAMTFALAALLAPVALHAQQAVADEQPVQAEQAAPSLRDKLIPAPAALSVTAPVLAEKSAPTTPVIQPVMQTRGQGVALMIAGGALFLAGLLIDDDDAGTVLMVTGAGVGAYGLYLHFR